MATSIPTRPAATRSATATLGCAIAGLLCGTGAAASTPAADPTPTKADRHSCCAAPSTGGSIGNPTTGGGNGPTTPRSSEVTPTALTGSGYAPTTWQHFWLRNREELLGSRPIQARRLTGKPINDGGVPGGPPPRIDKRAIDALLAALERSNQPDLSVATAIGLGRAAKALPGDRRVLPALRELLTEKKRDVRDAATLALGISGHVSATPTLLHLIGDTATGRKLVGRGRVDTRTRSLAAYGLGLLVRASDDERLREIALDAMTAQVGNPRGPAGDLRLAFAHAIRLVASRGVHRPGDAVDLAIRERATEALWQMFRVERTFNQNALLPLLGRIAGRDSGDVTKKVATACLALLRRDGSRDALLHRGAIIALGRVAHAREVEAADAPYSNALLDYATNGRDRDTRGLAMIALGRIGGKSNQLALRRQLRNGSKNQVKPWAAIALGIASRIDGSPADPATTRDLLTALESSQSTRGAIALGLGLHGDTRAEPQLRKLLARTPRANETEFFCDAVALLGAPGAKPDLRKTLDRTKRFPLLAAAAGRSLGYLGDTTAADQLLVSLDECGNRACAPLATALGWLGDESVAADLVKVLAAPRKSSKRVQAFAAIALGGLADPDPLSWKSHLFADGEPPLLASR